MTIQEFRDRLDELKRSLAEEILAFIRAAGGYIETPPGNEPELPSLTRDGTATLYSLTADPSGDDFTAESYTDFGDRFDSGADDLSVEDLITILEFIQTDESRPKKRKTALRKRKP